MLVPVLVSVTSGSLAFLHGMMIMQAVPSLVQATKDSLFNRTMGTSTGASDPSPMVCSLVGDLVSPGPSLGGGYNYCLWTGLWETSHTVLDTQHSSVTGFRILHSGCQQSKPGTYEQRDVPEKMVALSYPMHSVMKVHRVHCTC